MFDVVTLGNALIDAFLTVHEADEHIHIDPQSRELRITPGAKINLEKSQFLLGGNAANVAVGLRRLGLRSAVVCETGSDEFTQKIIHGLEREAVETALIRQTAAPSSFAIALNFRGERTLFVQHVPRKHQFDLSGVTSKWLYLTSLGHVWEETYRQVGETVKEKNLLLAFNPGSLQLAAGVEKFAYLLPLTTVLFVNRQEAEEIAGDKPSSVGELLAKTKAKGPKNVVLTDGQNGSYAATEAGIVYKAGIHPAQDVERTGAGDAYATGFLAAVIHGETVPQAMRWGAANSASVIEQVGAETGLLTKTSLQEKLSAHELTVREVTNI